MTNIGITELIKHPQVLDVRDSVRRAAGIIRASEGSCALVVRDGRIAGSVSEGSIAGFLASETDQESALGQPIESLVEHYPVFISLSISARDAARTFAENNVDMLPVVDEYGGLRGALYRSDVVGYLTMSLRPPSVGGMATPLGVYLTTGSISGGAGSIGLYLTGISLGLMMIVSMVTIDHVMKYLIHIAGPRSPFIGVQDTVTAVLSILMLLALLRLSPLAGYHAAEHMTVHAIEAGEDLTPDIVRRMPRVHPRCGTNILAGAMIFMLITSQFGSDMAVLVAMVVLVIGWKTVGNWKQAFFTTKTPSESQLRSGIAAGQQILKRFHERPGYQAYGFKRVWNMGFLQAAAGMGTVMTCVYMLEKLFPRMHLLF